MAQPQGTMVQQLDEQQTVRPNTILYLMDAEAATIRFTGSKTPTLADAFNADWLADGATLVYLSKTSGRFAPDDGDASRGRENRTCFSTGTLSRRCRGTPNGIRLSRWRKIRERSGHRKSCSWIWSTEKRKEIAPLDEYAGFLIDLAVSEERSRIFKDGDTLEVRDWQIRAKARCGWRSANFNGRRRAARAAETRRAAKSADLVWVGLTTASSSRFFTAGISRISRLRRTAKRSRSPNRASREVVYRWTKDDPSRRADAKPLDVFLQNAGVHDDEYACAARAFRRLGMDHAFLHPDCTRADADRGFHDLRHKFGTPENVHDVDFLGMSSSRA